MQRFSDVTVPKFDWRIAAKAAAVGKQVLSSSSLSNGCHAPSAVVGNPAVIYARELGLGQI